MADPAATFPTNADKPKFFDPSNPPKSGKIIKTESVNDVINKSSKSRVRPSRYLRNMYEITLQDGVDIEKEINRLLQYTNIVYAEPVYTEQILLVPNDPQASPTSGSQAHLEVINAYSNSNKRIDLFVLVSALNMSNLPFPN